MGLTVAKANSRAAPTKKRSRYGPPIQLCIDGIGLERVNEFKYLGVWLTDTLGWSVHVNKTVRRASKQVGMTYRTFYQYASQSTLLKLYLSHVRPLLEYASELWDPHQKVLVDSLERVQKFGLRMSCKQWRSDYESLLVWADLPSLKTRRSKAKLCYLNKMLRGGTSSGDNNNYSVRLFSIASLYHIPRHIPRPLLGNLIMFTVV